MANQSAVGNLTVEVEGTELPPVIVAQLASAMVEDNRNVPDSFELRFSANVLADAKIKIGAKVKLSVHTGDESSPTQLLAGEVVGLDVVYQPHSPQFIVRGLDESHRLFHRRATVYAGQTIEDIVRKVAEENKLKVGTIDDCHGILSGGDDEQYSQIETDWAMLQRFATLTGNTCTVVDGELNFVAAAKPDDAPGEDAQAHQDPLVLQAGGNLIQLFLQVSAVGQPSSVEVRARDAKTQETIVATADVVAVGIEAAAFAAGSLAGIFGAPPVVVHSVVAGLTHAAAEAIAKAYADQIASAGITCHGTARGNPKLHTGAVVRVSGLGEPFGLTGVLSRTRHIFSPHATVWYTTEFEITGSADTSLAALMGGGSGAGAGRSELMIGQVSNIEDPNKEGRVKVKLSALATDFETGWARTVHPGAGKGRGMYWLPEVGDEVLVVFEGGNLNQPLVLGGLHNSTSTPPKTDSPVTSTSGSVTQVEERVLVSRTGHELVFAETTSGDDLVRLATGEKKFKIVLDKKNTEIVVDSDGKVTITAKQGISIDAGTGDLTLKGANVAISGQSIKLN